MNHIDYFFTIKQSPKTGLFHVVFDCILAAGKLAPKLSAIIGDPTALYYSHNGGFQNSIVLTIPGAELWNTYIAPFVWTINNRSAFKITIDGKLLLPERCSRCNCQGPMLTVTDVENRRAVASSKYCYDCSYSYTDMLIGAAHDG